MKQVEIYTDGACSGNPGAGGFCAILIYGKTEKIISGQEKYTTNNRMELRGVIEGLRALKETCSVRVYSDSSYVVNAFNKNWIESWVENNFKEHTNHPIVNRDLWEELLMLTQKHNVTFIKVKGHSDNELNNRADKIAVEESKRVKL